MKKTRKKPATNEAGPPVGAAATEYDLNGDPIVVEKFRVIPEAVWLKLCEAAACDVLARIDAWLPDAMPCPSDWSVFEMCRDKFDLNDVNDIRLAPTLTADQLPKKK